MYGALGVTQIAKYFAVAIVVYEVVQVGPYESARILGRCVRYFFLAAQGYL